MKIISKFDKWHLFTNLLNQSLSKTYGRPRPYWSSKLPFSFRSFLNQRYIDIRFPKAYLYYALLQLLYGLFWTYNNNVTVICILSIIKIFIGNVSNNGHERWPARSPNLSSLDYFYGVQWRIKFIKLHQLTLMS